jgi:REP element-mobilizing transposase RayT
MTSKGKDKRRRSMRLRGYDYSLPGYYFITVCTKDRRSTFGEIVKGEMLTNEAGRIAVQVWEELPSRFSCMQLDEMVVMPNHMHGIIAIVGAGLALPNDRGAASSAPTLPDIVRAFKSISSIRINRLLSRSGRPLWQRNYFEHIIRDEDSLARIRHYIQINPKGWKFDRENPDHIGEDDFYIWLSSFHNRPEGEKDTSAKPVKGS